MIGGKKKALADLVANARMTILRIGTSERRILPLDSTASAFHARRSLCGKLPGKSNFQFLKGVLDRRTNRDA